MKLSPLIIGGVIVVVLAIGGGIYYVTTRDDTGTVTTKEVSTGEKAELGDTKDACEVFTLEIAKTVLGEGAIKSELPAGSQASTDDVSVTNCVYEVEGSEGFQVANALVRGAKTDEGRESNRFGFAGNEDRSNFEGTGMEYGPVEPISGLGDGAFYDPDFTQVNILVDDGHYWLIVQGETRDQSEQIAQLVVTNL